MMIKDVIDLSDANHVSADALTFFSLDFSNVAILNLQESYFATALSPPDSRMETCSECKEFA